MSRPELVGSGMYSEVFTTNVPGRVKKVHRPGASDVTQIENEHLITRIASDKKIGPKLHEGSINYDEASGYLVLDRLYDLLDIHYDNPNPAWARQLLAKVQELHGQGIVHNDLRPVNIMFSRDHSEVFIIDYGVATFPKTPEEGIFLTFNDYMMLLGSFNEFGWDDKEVIGAIKTLGPMVSEAYHETDAYEGYLAMKS